VYAAEARILPERPSGCHAFFVSKSQQPFKVVDLARRFML
jgi:hypothetical protein